MSHLHMNLCAKGNDAAEVRRMETLRCARFRDSFSLRTNARACRVPLERERDGVVTCDTGKRVKTTIKPVFHS